MSTQKSTKPNMHPFNNTQVKHDLNAAEWSNGRFMMPYLQVPYLRVPLLLQFFNDRKRFTALSSPQLQVPRDFFGWWIPGCVLNGTNQKNRSVGFGDIFFCEKDDELT